MIIWTLYLKRFLKFFNSESQLFIFFKYFKRDFYFLFKACIILLKNLNLYHEFRQL